MTDRLRMSAITRDRRHLAQTIKAMTFAEVMGLATELFEMIDHDCRTMPAAPLDVAEWLHDWAEAHLEQTSNSGK